MGDGEAGDRMPRRPKARRSETCCLATQKSPRRAWRGLLFLSKFPKMKEIYTNKLAQPSETQAQRWTFKSERKQTPMACLLDYFPGGFRTRQYSIELVEVLGFEVVPGDVIAATSDPDNTPCRIFWAYVDFGAVCVPVDWLEPIREQTSGDFELLPEDYGITVADAIRRYAWSTDLQEAA